MQPIRLTISALVAVAVVTVSTTAFCQTDSTLTARTVAAFQSSDWPVAIDGFRQILQHNPEDGSSWYRLGSSLLQAGRFPEAIEAYVKSDSLGVAVSASRYNIACAYSRMDEKDSALEWLGKAIDGGFIQVQTLNTDSDLDNLRGEAAFADLVEKTKRNATPCMYDEAHSVMDFWLGEWDVYIGSRLVGFNKITKVSDGCAILEDWTSAQGTTGMSLNFYDANVQKWKQTWVGGYVGEYVEESHGEGEILFGYSGTGSDGTPVLNRLMFKLLEDGSVRQLFSASSDSGKTWQPSFDGRYVKRAPVEADDND